MMNNLSIVPGMSNAAAANQPVKGKGEPQGNVNFLQAASASFLQLTPAQTARVPGSHDGQPAKFWKEKQQIEEDIPTLEEGMEDHVAELLNKIKRLFSEQQDK